MDFVRRIRKNKCEITKVESLEQLYQYNVNFYYNPPAKDINLRVLEDSVIERLKVLYILEQASGKFLNSDSCVEWKKQVLSEFKSQKLFDYVQLIECDSDEDTETLLLARERDYISHFILRFYYCESDVLRQWFIDREIELFRLKFDSMTSEQKQSFLNANNLNYIRLNYNEVKYETFENQDCEADQQNIGENLQFYKVKFIEVLNLISARECILKNGYAYVTNLSSIIETIHRSYIEKGLLSTHRMVNVIKEDVRIADLLKTIHNERPGHGLVSTDEHTLIESIDSLATKYFPLCARMCHETLREKHHLKYFGRNQYQLFLKGIGVSLEDSLKFWIQEFTHNNKDKPLPAKYRYQVEYNYGRRGSKIDIQPPSCADLISMNYPSFQQCYGCPYNFMDPSHLKTTLIEHGLNSVQVDEVLHFSNKNDFQLACSKYFEVVNDYQPHEVISNPNRYYELCQMVEKIKRKQTEEPSAINKSLNDSLYDKHLWEMLSPAKDNTKNMENIDDLMSQIDFNY